MLCFSCFSGTTWLGEILYLLISDINIKDLYEKMCYIRMLWIDDKRTHRLLDDFPSPRLMKSHLPVSLLPPSAFTSRIVLAVRHPKDLAVAYYHFYKINSHFGNFPRPFEEFVNMFMRGYVHWGNWTRHLNAWWEIVKTQDNILPVFYEHTKANPHKTVRKLAQFLGKEISDKEVECIVQETSFAKMKARPTSNFEHIPALSGPFIRKGEVGDWKNHFNDEQSANFDAWISSEIKNEELRNHLNIQ